MLPLNLLLLFLLFLLTLSALALEHHSKNPLLHPLHQRHSSKRCPDKEWDLRHRLKTDTAQSFKVHNSHRFCGGRNAYSADATAAFKANETSAPEDCGNWKDRFWYPRSCHYQDIKPEEARKCIGNRTLAFVGDSQIRDIGFGVALFLAGAEIASSPEEKFDKHRDNINLSKIATKIEDFKHWQHNVPEHNYNGHIFPEKNLGLQNGWEYQIQVWNLFRNEFHGGNQLEDVLNNKLIQHNPLLRSIDLAFWSHGLHDWGWWDKEPYGQHYYETMTNQWISKRKSLQVDSVWVSMNNECLEKLKDLVFKSGKVQYLMVEAANDFVNHKLSDEGLPYWDAAAPLRTLERCNHMADGVHVKMYVDIMRAKMLFNHLCDQDMRWIGSSSRFS